MERAKIESVFGHASIDATFFLSGDKTFFYIHLSETMNKKHTKHYARNKYISLPMLKSLRTPFPVTMSFYIEACPVLPSSFSHLARRWRGVLSHMTEHPVDGDVIVSRMEIVLSWLTRGTPWDKPSVRGQIKVVFEKVKRATMDKDCPAAARFGICLLKSILELLQ